VISHRPRVLAVLPSLFPSTILNVARPLLRLHQARVIDLDLTFQALVTRAAAASADVLVLSHSIDPTFGRILDWARDFGTPLIYDVDDNLLEPPEDVAGLGYLREPARRALVIACLRQADAVRVYSPVLREVFAPYNPSVVAVSGPLEWQLMPEPLPPADPSRVRIVYATSRQLDQIGRLIVAPLRRVLEAFPIAEATIWGPRIEGLSGHPRVRHLPYVRSYERYFTRLALERFDIGLAPLADDSFHRAKTNLKYREYGACGIAGVYADSPVYNTSVVDGATGLVAGPAGDAWFAAMARLIEDVPLRTHIQANARADVRARYNEAATDAAWMAHITPLAERRRATAGQAAAADRPRSRGRPLATAAALVRQGCRLAMQAPPILWRYGPTETASRAWRHVRDFGRMLGWELHRWRLQHRLPSSK